MTRYTMLILPSANRVYAAASVDLVRAELAAFSDAVLHGSVGSVAPLELAGVPYVEFAADELSPRAAAFLANVSGCYALFEVTGEGLLRPIDLHHLDRYDDDLITIQKYPGKTNEQFTKLLLNVTLMASAFADQMLDRKLSVLDPLCGRGTTLNQALMYGFDAAGIDLDQKDFDAYTTFVKTWLKRKRLKHKVQYDGPVRRDGKTVARRFEVGLAASKEERRTGQTQQLDVVCADSTRALEFFKPATFDAVVTDAPYGVQHGSHGAGARLARRPLDLLAAALPAWATLLRPGGALGIAVNTLVATREDVVALLTSAGLEPVDSYGSFRHRVDQAIVRDIVVARKSPAAGS